MDISPKNMDKWPISLWKDADITNHSGSAKKTAMRYALNPLQWSPPNT